eukprot:285794-Pelagomonas_calceolata.AAC.5
MDGHLPRLGAHSFHRCYIKRRAGEASQKKGALAEPCSTQTWAWREAANSTMQDMHARQGSEHHSAGVNK